MLNYKKPGFWISLLGVIAILFVAVCLVTSPAEEAPVPPPEATETAPGINVVTVKNPDELLAAIASNTEILLEPGTYILSEASNYGQSISDYCVWSERYDGWQLTLKNVENLTIRGSGLHVTVIETDPRHANVLGLENCTNVTLEDFTAGHTRDRGECGGGVIDIRTSSGITMNRLGIFGCGVIGVQADGCADIALTDCDIYECSSSAVNLFGSQKVTISGNRIYEIGNELYGGYTFFDIQDSFDVTIESNQLSDSTLNNLVSTVKSQVELKNNLFKGNRPQSGVFSGSDVSITMEDNRFMDNSIRNWYVWAETARDETGRTLTEEDLHALYGTAPEPAEPQEPRLEIHVSTVDEFIAALGPDKEIVLDAAVYDLSTATGYGISSGEYYYWEDIFDGPGLIIRNVRNMVIRTATGDKDKHSITAVPRYADVLTLKACSNVTLSGFTAGHTEEPGGCVGGVLEFRDSDHITVENCGLFGCGILGVQAEDCSDITVNDTEIYECSEGGINLRNVNDIRIENVTFRDIGGRNTIYMDQCKNAYIDMEKVIGGDFGSYVDSTLEQKLTFALNEVVINFAEAYLNNDTESMQWYLVSGYEPEAYVCTKKDAWPRTLWYEITYSHVADLKKAHTMVFEVPYRDVSYQEELQYLLITVVEESGTFKVSDCQVKE